MPFILVFIVHPALEVPFASVWPMLRAGAVRFRVGCMCVWGLVTWKSGSGGGGDIKELRGLARDRGTLLAQ